MNELFKEALSLNSSPGNNEIPPDGSAIDLSQAPVVLQIMLENLEQSKNQIEHAHQEWLSALDVVSDPIFLHDKQHRILRCNRVYQQLAGLPFHEIIGKPYYEIFPKTGSPLPCCLESTEKAEEDEAEVTIGDTIYRSRAFAIKNKEGTYLCSVHSLEDITGRKQEEIAIQHANRAIATLGAVNHELVHATIENDLLQAICRVIVDHRGYQLALVGYVQHDEAKSIKIMAHAGYTGDYPDSMQITWAETEHGMGPSGRAVRSGTTQICHDFASDQLVRPWREKALKHGYASSITLPLMDGDNTVFGILHVHAEEKNAFSPAEVGLLEEMAGDLAFGVRTLRVRQERDHALEQNKQQLVKLQDRLEDTVEAIATIAEMRDPYTSGHQVRVADLASTISRQMGLPDEQVHAIYLAGIMHDLGKIRIPAEILSKPGRITEIEYSLIKIHPQAGYEILKGIDFPWPIAQMVLQHHEKLDGTGYPQGLKGDAILLEARILSVADVVEAMSSHRPYRPGLGIEAALAEIIKQRGTHFDPVVVDACLAVVREQHYAFKF